MKRNKRSDCKTLQIFSLTAPHTLLHKACSKAPIPNTMKKPMLLVKHNFYPKNMFSTKETRIINAHSHENNIPLASLSNNPNHIFKNTSVCKREVISPPYTEHYGESTNHRNLEKFERIQTKVPQKKQAIIYSVRVGKYTLQSITVSNWIACRIQCSQNIS